MATIKNHLLSIAPLVPIPFGKSGLFSYLPEKNAETVPPGSIVSISFGPRNVRGVVWNTPAKNPPFTRRFRYKAIRKILAEAFLSGEQLALAEYITSESRIALGTALEQFVPTTLEATPNSLSKNPKPLSVSSGKKYRLTPEQKKVVRTLLTSPKPSTLLFGPSASGKTFIIFELIRTLLARGGQALILVPDRAILLQEEVRYTEIFGQDAVGIFHTKEKARDAETFRAHVRKGDIRIILGTSPALFLPFRNLRLIVEDDADAPSYESIGLSSSLPTRAIAEKLVEFHAARFVRVSATPSFESYFRAEEAQTLVTLPLPASLRETHSEFHIVNLRLEKWKKKLAPISETLQYAIASVLAEKQQAILCVNRSGMSAFSVCADCKKVLRCPACTRALSYKQEGDYRCARCGAHAGATPSCPACGSLAFKHIGVGTEHVERDLRRKFPGVRTVRYDAASRNRVKTFTELGEFIRGERDILITTERGVRGWDLPRVSLVGMIDADTFLNTTHWDGDERALRVFLSATGRVGRTTSSRGTVVIQTFHPENPLFEYTKENTLPRFFETLEEERRQFLYPPFGMITNFICRMSNEKKLREEVERVRTLLESARSKRSNKTYLSISDTARKIQGRLFEIRGAIREVAPTVKNPAQFPSDFEEIFDQLPPSWTVERNTL